MANFFYQTKGNKWVGITIEFIRNMIIDFIKSKQITPNRSELTACQVTCGKASHLSCICYYSYFTDKEPLVTVTQGCLLHSRDRYQS